jgi:hypothetical protein
VSVSECVCVCVLLHAAWLQYPAHTIIRLQLALNPTPTSEPEGLGR